MENPLSLRLIKEEQESSEKLLELLVSSTHSPKGRFSKEDSYIMLKRKMETTKKENTVKLVLPFPHFLWMIGTNPGRYAGRYSPGIEPLCHASGTGY